MPVVVDTSAAFKWARVEEFRMEALAPRDNTLRAGDALLAPHLIIHEATNVLTKWVVDGIAGPGVVPLALRNIFGAVTLRPFDQILAERAVEMGVIAGKRRFGFDAQFLALAEREGCDFWTGDRDFSDALRLAFPFVRWIGAYTALPSP